MNLLNYFSKDQQVVNEYFRLRRQQRFERYGPRAKAIGFHNAIHHILLFALKAMRLFEKRKLVILADRRKHKGKRPTIYACAHIGGKDVESLFEAIRKPCYLFLGDPGPAYRSLDGLMLGLNGVIALDTKNKTDRRIAKERATALLKQGGSLMIFPEGAWNITENEPIMKLYAGTAMMALESGADIVPVALEKHGETYYAIVGEELSCSNFADKNAKELTAQLRDILSTLKWEIWENFGVFFRRELNPEEFYKDLDLRFDLVDGYTYQDVVETRYYDKSITATEEVFSHLDKITPTRQNAFLFAHNEAKK